VTFKQGEEHPFLGRDLTEPKDFSEHTAQVIDEEVERIVHDMEKKAREVLEPNRDKLDAIAKALMEHETLENKDIDEILGQDHDPQPEESQGPHQSKVFRLSNGDKIQSPKHEVRKRE
jgi:cell division protease FtsH